MARMKETIAIMGGMHIWKYRSPVLSACQALINTMIVPIRYGGVVKRSVSILSLPSPDITLKKKKNEYHCQEGKLSRERISYLGKKVVTAPADVQP